MCCGVLEGIPEIVALYGLEQGGEIDVPVLSWLLRAEGLTVLVDTGPTSTESAKEKHGRTLNQAEGNTLSEQLRALGVALEDVDYIINTHLHWDHCAGNRLFPSIPIHVQREEIRFATAPIPTQLRAYEAFQLGNIPPWVECAPQFVLADGPVTLAPGLSLIPLPGHTPGSQGVLIRTNEGEVCITGDLLDTYENWNGRLPGWPEWVVGIPPGIHTDLDAWYRSVRELRARGIEVIPAHDWAVLRHGPIGGQGRS
jgi:glyoxylase-like metal-dependent hydrolase (beta-lactamase superfamily II)